jgi:hypothetical protein
LAPAASISRQDRFTRRALVLLGLIGALLLIDGALRGELRHRLAGIALGGALMLPLASVALLGPRLLKPWRKVSLSAFALLIAFALAEGTVRAFDLKAISVAELEPDPVLGHVHRPSRAGMDAWGFRNEGVPQRADIACVGDSQTYGANIRARDSWPRALARASGLATFSLSLGGYGPLQYAVLTERAMELAPRAVVVAFFLGNDLVDAHRFAGLEHWAELRDPALAYRIPDDVPRGDPRSLNLTMALLDGLMSRSRLLGRLGEDLKLQLKINPALARLFQGGAQPTSFEQGSVSTHFTPEYRLGSVDLERPEVRDGLRITATCLDRISAACRARDVELVLLLIPTKEAIYARWLSERGDARAAGLSALASAERAAAGRVLALAGERSIPVVDPTSELVGALEGDVACWPSNSDGHFNPQGCERLAAALWRELGPRLQSARH